MRNLKFIIATVLLGLLASCSSDSMDEDCGCMERTILIKTYYVIDGNNQLQARREKVYGDWSPAPCGETGIEVFRKDLSVETKCN